MSQSYWPAANRAQLIELRLTWPMHTVDDDAGAALWTTDDYGMVIVIPLTTANLTEWSRAAAIAALGGDVAA